MARVTIEELATDCVDVRDLRKAGALDGKWVSFRWPEFRWPTVRKMRASRYLVQIQLRNQVVPQQVLVSWTRCNFGGLRPWLHCICGQRVARLFKGFGGYYCRPCCGNPIYESQKRNEKARSYLQAYRLRERLGGSRPPICTPQLRGGHTCAQDLFLVGEAYYLLTRPIMVLGEGMSGKDEKTRIEALGSPDSRKVPRVTKRRRKNRGMPPPATFDIDMLPGSSNLTALEAAAVVRRTPGALEQWRRDPNHPLKWRYVDGRPLYRVDAVRNYLAGRDEPTRRPQPHNAREDDRAVRP